MPMARWLVSRGTQASRQFQRLWSFDDKQKEQTCGTTRFSLRPRETAFSDHSGPLTPSFQRTDPGLSVQPDFVVDTENSKTDSETEWVDDSGAKCRIARKVPHKKVTSTSRYTSRTAKRSGSTTLVVTCRIVQMMTTVP